MTKEITTPANLLEMAVSQNADMDKLEKLMDLQLRWEENEARKAYHVAMAAFKVESPEITKDRHVKYGNTEYKHASLHNVTNTINKALSEHGLNATWKTHQNDQVITVTCTITHVNGFSESTSLSATPDTSGAKNSIQAIGSTVSYLERYTILAATGLSTADMDDDGTTAGTIPIPEEQVMELEAMIKDNNLTADKDFMPRFLAFVNAPSLDQIPAKTFSKAKSGLQQHINKKVKK